MMSTSPDSRRFTKSETDPDGSPNFSNYDRDSRTMTMVGNSALEMKLNQIAEHGEDEEQEEAK